MASCTYNPGINSVNPYAVLNVTEKSQNIEKNTTVVRWELRLYRPSRISSSTSKAYSVQINGSTVKSGSVVIGGSGTLLIASGEVTIPHNADGKKKISFGFSLNFGITWSGVAIGTGKASGSADLTTIPRATTPKLSPSYVTLGGTINIELPRASSTFTHVLTWSFGRVSGTIGSDLETEATLETAVDWASVIPNGIEGTGAITCETYNGNTLIGTKSVKFKASVPASVVPEISDVAITEGTAGLAEKFGAYVQNKSRLKVVTTASGAHKSTIKSCKVVIDGNTYTGTDITTGLITSSGEVEVSVTVTDSRGRTKTLKKSVVVQEYSTPTINLFSVQRGNSSGNPDIDGTYALIRMDFSISPVNNNNDNSYKIEYKTHKETSWKLLGTYNAYEVNKTINGGDILGEDNPYMFRLTIADYFGSVTIEKDNIPTGFTLFNVNISGKSIAFGGVSQRGETEKCIDFKMHCYDPSGRRINNGLAVYTGSGSNGLDPDTTLDELIVTDVNTPMNGKFMYIQTFFYMSKTETSNRGQIAIPYNQNGSMYHRFYANGTWSPWRRHVNEDEIK